MTQVVVTPTDYPVSIEFSPFVGSVAPNVDLPEPIVMFNVNGPVTIDLAPTAYNWCWKGLIRYQSGPALRIVAVPDDTDTHDYNDLVNVNPETLSAASVPEAAWWIAMNTLKSLTPVVLTQAEYDARTPDPNTLYLIVDPTA